MNYIESIENTPEPTRTVEHVSIYPHSVENYHYVINGKTTNTISEVCKDDITNFCPNCGADMRKGGTEE